MSSELLTHARRAMLHSNIYVGTTKLLHRADMGRGTLQSAIYMIYNVTGNL